MSFVIDDMGEFCRVVKLLVNIILDDMTYIQRKVFVTLASGSEKSLQKELDDLPKTVEERKFRRFLQQRLLPRSGPRSRYQKHH